MLIVHFHNPQGLCVFHLEEITKVVPFETGSMVYTKDGQVEVILETPEQISKVFQKIAIDSGGWAKDAGVENASDTPAKGTIH